MDFRNYRLKIFPKILPSFGRAIELASSTVTVTDNACIPISPSGPYVSLHPRTTTFNVRLFVRHRSSFHLWNGHRGSQCGGSVGRNRELLMGSRVVAHRTGNGGSADLECVVYPFCLCLAAASILPSARSQVRFINVLFIRQSGQNTQGRVTLRSVVYATQSQPHTVRSRYCNKSCIMTIMWFNAYILHFISW